MIRSLIVLILASFTVSAVVPVLADTPPPIPTAADRERFVTAHNAAAHGHWALDRAAPRAVHDEYDVTHYDITMSVDIPDEIVYGTVTVTAASAVADLDEIALDLYECLTVNQVLVNGSPVFHSHEPPILRVPLDGTYQPGETFTVTGTYHGTPEYSLSPFRFAQQPDGRPMVLSYSEPYGAPAWWLCKDDPKDKATYDLHFTVADSMMVVSNGILESVDDNHDGTLTYNWSTDYPMSTYLFSICATVYESWTEEYVAMDGETTMDMDYYAYPADLADAQIDWSNNLQMMNYYRTLFGEYPFLEEKYAIAEFQHPGAMEHQTATSMGWLWLTGDNRNDFVVAHELSHSWVGDMITMRTWDHTWTKEGFATHCEALYFENLYSSNYYHSYMNAMNVYNYAQFQLHGINPPLHAAIYYKGAWVLHMLRHVIGDAAFFDGLMAYTQDPDYRFGVTDTDDLRDTFEGVSGMNLDWFFDQWIYSPGYPTYEYGWSFSPVATGYEVVLSLSQRQIPSWPTFKMPIDVEIATDQGEERFVVWDSLRVQTFTLQVEGTPQGLSLDPDRWMIRNLEPAGVEELDIAPATILTQNAPNPFHPSTWITYRLGRKEEVSLDVYSISGRWITRLLDGVQPAGSGRVAWNGLDARGRRVAPGVYFYRLRAGEAEQSRRMILAR
ncbi:MAG: T9SS type A sorting domain-containing protein [Candidatus Eisenbacteria bacterium]|nr:T9SS type A sorting domain-containing protein [Candidatus Latescibacterota bacterium]MBD3302833.1 T9SS type A sorting domain-containing protein [Candidatus Eisenbacteria bacterium]